MPIEALKFVPWIPLIGAVLCGICCMRKPLVRFAGPICVLSLFIAFLIAVLTYGKVISEPAQVVTFFKWLAVGVDADGQGGFQADFAYYIDTLTMVMLFVVTGIGSLVALYATGYMKGEKGFARFFAGVSLFIFAMTSMVMGDNLIVLYLGWEMVGLASYLLIGYYYTKPSAVAAAKKAFIVNRIGDLGFALGIFTVYMTFGSVRYAEIIPAAQAMIGSIDVATLSQTARAAYDSATAASQFAVMAAPLLLMLGAIGKSAQIPLYVWLPDAMEGPSPVSALIHAATMVTSGVYMIARLLPLFEYSPYALPTVATIGGVTAIFAGTIALCQYDIKRVFAFSTVSQLGYMFLGVGVLSSVGGMWHLISHAFFKGLLFLTAGSVMHAMAGQLDLRKMSGLRHKMPVTCWLMFAACLSLAGVPLTSGFFSKDLIIAAVFDRAQMEGTWATGYYLLGVAALVTAFITASYGFRVWFRVFMGPERYEMGEDSHGAPEPQSPDHSETEKAQKHDDAGHGHAHTADHGHHHAPHEMPLWPMNLPLLVLALGATIGWVFVGFLGSHKYGWIGSMVYGSTGKPSVSIKHGTLLGMDVHYVMMAVSGLLAIGAIALAAHLHWLNRDAGARLAARFTGLVKLLAAKYYVDEFYDKLIVKPLRLKAELFFLIDQLVIDVMVQAIGWLPGNTLGKAAQKTQSGRLQGYGLGMAAGLAVLAVVIFIVMN